MTSTKRPRYSELTRPSRRMFVKGLALGGVVAGLGLWRDTAWAQGAPRPATDVRSGTDFDLNLGETLVNFTGSPKIAHTVNGSLPAPVLRWREGDTVTLRVANRLRGDQASIHWHGILLPANMDGVPGLSVNGIAPGESYVYRFMTRPCTTSCCSISSSGSCRAGKSDPEHGIGAGLSSLGAGLRLRCEFRLELAPYVGVRWKRKFFGAARPGRGSGRRHPRCAIGARVYECGFEARSQQEPLQ